MNEITIYWNKIILWQIYSLDIDENIVLQSYQQSRHMTGCHGFVRDLYNAFNVLYNKPLSPWSV